MSPSVTFSLVFTWLRSSLGVARLRLLTMEVLLLRCSRLRWITADSQLTFNTVYWMAIGDYHGLSSQSQFMLQPTVSRQVCLGVKPNLEHKFKFFVLSESFIFVVVGRPLWREDGYVVYNCCWPGLIKFKVNVTLGLEVYRQSVYLRSKPVEAHDQRFLQLNPCGHSPHVTFSLTRGLVCLLWICFASPLSSVCIAHIACYWNHPTAVVTYS
jgi:hypothetical protein